MPCQVQCSGGLTKPAKADMGEFDLKVKWRTHPHWMFIGWFLFHLLEK
jgi:hypothetical protein